MAPRSFLTAVVVALLAPGAYAAPRISLKTHSAVRDQGDRSKELKTKSVNSRDKKHGKFGRIMKGVSKGLFRRALGFVDPSLPDVFMPPKQQTSTSAPLKRTTMKPNLPRRRARFRNKVTIRPAR